MVLGTAVVGEVYHNRIVNGTGWGVHYMGLGNLNFHNNIIINSGTEGLYFNGIEGTTTQPNSYIRIINNTIVKTVRYGIYINNYNQITNRVAVNNIIAEVPANFSVFSGGFTEKSHNLENRDATELKFVRYQENSDQDFSSNDYHLQQESPAVDAGKNASVYSADNIAYDFDGTPRNYGGAYDIGAYEYDGVVDPGNGNETPWELFINAAGVDYSVTENGDTILWEQDMPHPTLDNSYNTYGTGGTASFSGANTTSAPPQVLGSYRYTLNTGTTIKYDIPVPISGAIYDVELFFARKNADTYVSGARRFNIVVEGQTVTTYDVYDEGGTGGTGASSYSYSTAVNDGILELKFVAVSGAHAQINAITVKKQAAPVPNPTTSITLFINSGGDEFEVDDLTIWEGDKPHPTLDTSVITYATGGTASFFGANATSAPEEVLGSNRFTLSAGNTIRYKIPVPKPGADYDIELFFARKNNATYTSGGRRFNIIIEGQTLTTYDIYDQGGPDGTAASSYLHTATVNDDTLEVAFVAVAGSSAQINAIRVDGPVESGSLMQSQTAQTDMASIQEAQIQFDIYPNPTSDHIDIIFAAEDTYHLKILTRRTRFT